MRRALLLSCVFTASAAMALVATAQQSVVGSTSPAAAASPVSAGSQPSKNSKTDSSAGAKTAVHVEPSVRIEGEKRFRANCSRCHMAPQKLPPRAAATIIRHMRVRATITDEDMRYILAYLAQ